MTSIFKINYQSLRVCVVSCVRVSDS